MLKKALLTLILFFLFFGINHCYSAEPPAETNYYYPVSDAYVYEKNNINSSHYTELYVGSQKADNFDNVKSILKFDLSKIPENASVIEAKLYVYALDESPSVNFQSIEAYPAPNNWDESSVNWSQLDNKSAGIYNSSFIKGMPNSSPDYYFWSITDIVQSWVNGEPNYGIVLTIDSTGFDDYLRLYSSENLIFKPYLSVTFAVPLPDHDSSGFTTAESNALKADGLTASEIEIKKDETGTETDNISPGSIAKIPAKDSPPEHLQTPVNPLTPVISQHPEPQLTDAGNSVTFSIAVSGDSPLSFQWMKNGENIDRATSDSYTIASVSQNDEGFFSCRVINDAGTAVSDEAELYVMYPPRITNNPQPQSKKNGESAAFSVTASGSPPLSFQWKKDSIDIPGATSDIYEIASVQKDHEGAYTCAIRNESYEVISHAAGLTVFEPNPEIIPQTPDSEDIAGPASEQSKPKAGSPLSESHTVLPTSVNDSRLPSDTVEATDSIDHKLNPQPSVVIRHLSMISPSGQGLYVHNGNVLTFKGTASPHTILVSARLEDNRSHFIRDVSKGIQITPDTGEISGSAFVGSFRGADAILLRMVVQTSKGNQSAECTSNTLLVDKAPPQIQITEPKNRSYFNSSPIQIHGIASDNLSGIARVEISIDGGSTYRRVDSFKDGKWEYSFSPPAPNSEYAIIARSTDVVGLAAVSDDLTIRYNSPAPRIASSPAIQKIAKTDPRNIKDYPSRNAGKSDDNGGISTYRIINIKSSRFQPTELFSLKDDMAIIVKGYGGNVVTIKIMTSSGKTVFELTDFIPENKYKMWKWKLSQTGIFQAALFVDGNQKDDVYFKIIQ